MKPLAIELNNKLKSTVAMDLLSDFGQRMFFPKGIVVQSAEAKQKAKRYNATIGMAYKEGEAMELPSVKKLLPGLSPSDAVAYAPTGGLPDLVKLWKSEIVRKNPALTEERLSDPVVVAGLTNGIATVADLFVNPGESVVVPDMFWGNYRLIFEERRSASIASFPFFSEAGDLNIDGFKKAMKENANAEGKIVVILNFPNNPTGYSPSKSEAAALKQAITELADQGYKIAVITDDAYFGLFFEEDTYKSSLFNELAEAHDNVLAIKVDGATKEHYVWGFRVGFVTFGCKGMNSEEYTALKTKLAGAVRACISNSSRPGQAMLLTAMREASYEAERQVFADDMESRYRKIKQILAERKTGADLEALPFNSGYFMCFKLKKGNAEELRKALLEEGIGTISIQEKYLRVAFSAVDEQNLEDLYRAIFTASDRLCG